MVCLISRQAISQYISRKYQYVMFVVLNYCIQNIHSSKLECQFFKVSIIKVVISYMLWFTDFSSFYFRLCFHGFIEIFCFILIPSQGFVVGFCGSRIFCLHIYTMSSVEVPQVSIFFLVVCSVLNQFNNFLPLKLYKRVESTKEGRAMVCITVFYLILDVYQLGKRIFFNESPHSFCGLKILLAEFVGNEANRRIWKQVLQEN